jgi:hypothetical protein
LRIDVSNLLSGAIFIAIGAWFAGNAFVNLPVGTAQQMGPGFFPLALSGILIVLGLAIGAQAIGADSPITASVPWRGLILILAAPILFGLVINGLGLGPTVFLTSIVAAYASRRMTLFRALGIAGGLTVLCVLIFKVGLGVSVPTLGPWLAM